MNCKTTNMSSAIAASTFHRSIGSQPPFSSALCQASRKSATRRACPVSLRAVFNFLRRFSPRFIAIEHEDHFTEMFSDQIFLYVGHRASHERGGKIPRLPYFHAVEEPFDEYDAPRSPHRAKIKKLLRLPEAR